MIIRSASQRLRSHWPIVVGAVVSLLLHCAVLDRLSRASLLDGSGARVLDRFAPDRPEALLGAHRGRAPGVTWFGAADPTPHEAPLAEVEQSHEERSPARGPGVVSPASSAEPAAQAPSSSASFSAGPPIAPPSPAVPERGSLSLPPSPEPIAPPSPAVSSSPLQPAVAPVSKVAPVVAPSPAPVPAPAPPPEPPGGSRREADGFSPERPKEIVAGQPAAIEGLELITTRPAWPTLTRLTARPRSPAVRICFDSDGYVLEVDLLESSGIAKVDEPLLDALYNWRAEGAALRDEHPWGRGAEVFLKIGL